jgi:hypothetical protein
MASISYEGGGQSGLRIPAASLALDPPRSRAASATAAFARAGWVMELRIMVGVTRPEWVGSEREGGIYE